MCSQKLIFFLFDEKEFSYVSQKLSYKDIFLPTYMKIGPHGAPLHIPSVKFKYVVRTLESVLHKSVSVFAN